MQFRKMQPRKMQSRKMQPRKMQSRKMKSRNMQSRKMQTTRMQSRKKQTSRMQSRKMRSRKTQEKLCRTVVERQLSSVINGANFWFQYLVSAELLNFPQEYLFKISTHTQKYKFFFQPLRFFNNIRL